MVSKETVLKQIQSTSNEIAQRFDGTYGSDLDALAQELAVSYGLLLEVINDEKNEFPENDFQGALLYWTALNAILASLELLRRGYTKEPQMIMRNVLEIFAVAYDFHANPRRYKSFISNPEKFDSTKSVAEAKKVHAIIGQQYGMLSKAFTHVGPLHILPHKVTSGLCIGGMFNPKDQASVNIDVMAIMGTLEVLNSLLEFTFIPYIPAPRFWKQIGRGTYQYTPNKGRMTQIMNRMKKSIDFL